MFKKIVSSILALILVWFSILTVVSCTPTNLSKGFQQLYYKHAKIASFAASAAILNDAEEAKATSSDSALKGGTIGQKYLINKYGEMTIDNTLGKNFIINQTPTSKVSELFETTFGDSKYTFSSNGEPYIDKSTITASDDTGYIAGSTKYEGTIKKIEAILDLVTVGLSPSSLSTVVNLLVDEVHLTLEGEDGLFTKIFKYIEDNGVMLQNVLKSFILDYQTEKEMSIKDTIVELDKSLTTPEGIIQKFKLIFKTAYSYFDAYLKDKTLEYDDYIKNTKWSGGIADSHIDVTKATNILKYVSSTDPNIKKEKDRATQALITPLTNTMADVVGVVLQLVLKVKIAPKWEIKDAQNFVKSIFNTINGLLIYLEDNSPENVNKLVDINIKEIIKQLKPLVKNMDNDFYKDKIKPQLIKIVKSLNLSDKSLEEKIIEKLDDKNSLGAALFLITTAPQWKKVSPIIKKFINDKIKIEIPGLFDGILSFKPLSLKGDISFLNKVESDNTLWVLLGAFKNISVENIAKFLSEKFEAINGNLLFNLNNISDLIWKVNHIKVKVDNKKSDLISLSAFLALPEFKIKDKVSFVKVEEGKENQELYWYDKNNAPAEKQRPYMVLGLDGSGTTLKSNESVGSTIVQLFGGETSQLLYAVSSMLESVVVEIPKLSEKELDNKFFEPLYKKSNWTMDEFNKFASKLPDFKEGEDSEFSYNIYRKLPNGELKTYTVTIELDSETNYWSIIKITK